MRKATSKPIDAKKLRELVLAKGTIGAVSEDMGYSLSALTGVFRRELISPPMITSLETMYGIKYEDYAPKKEEPVVEKPKPETEVISRDEAQLKTIIAQLSALNNGLTAIYQKLEEINGNQKKEIHP